MRVLLMAGLIMSAAVGQNPASPKAAPPADDGSSSLESLLQTKVVTASRFSENLADAPGVMTVVSRDQIERFGPGTLREILSHVAGLDLSSNDFTDRSMVAVRGDQAKASGVHVLFLINGRPTREVVDGGTMSDLLEAFPVGIVERIEVIEGPGSVLYGSNAYSGVINVITRKADGKSGAVRGFGSGSGPIGGSAEGLYRRGDFTFVAAAQFHQDNHWTTQLAPDLGGGVYGRPVNYSLYDNSRGLFAEAGYKGFSAMLSSTQWRAPMSIFGSNDEVRWSRTFADVGYDWKPSKHWDAGLHATYTGTGFESATLPIVDLQGRELEVDWTNSIELNDRSRISFGSLFGFQAGTSRFISNGVSGVATDASRANLGIYAQLEHRLTDSLRLIGGFQTNKVEGIGVKTVPRAGVMWNPATHWFVKALYGEAFRAPTLNETTINNPYLMGNSKLLAELASTFDFGLIYQTNRLQTSLNFFRSTQSHNILPIEINPLLFRYDNVRGLHFQGVQWESKYYFRPHLLAEGSFLYQNNADSSGQRQSLPTPGVGAKAGLSYADRKGWTAGLFDVYSGLVPGYASSPNPKPAAHHLLTAHLRLGLERYMGSSAKGVALFAHGDNLANRAIWEPSWGYSSSSTVPAMRGRTIYYGIEFSYKRE